MQVQYDLVIEYRLAHHPLHLRLQDSHELQQSLEQSLIGPSHQTLHSPLQYDLKSHQWHRTIQTW